jgi:hypothetical protein
MIVVGIDGSKSAARALRLATEAQLIVAERTPAQVPVVLIVPNE